MLFDDIVGNKIKGITTDNDELIRKSKIRITFAPAGMRARKVVSRSNLKTTGKYPSWKLGRSVHYESTHERNAFRLLDACSEITSYREQPCRIEYVLDGEKHIHYPDIHIEHAHGKELWEVKTELDAANSEVEKRTNFMMKVLPHLGFNYRLVSAEILARNPRLSNVKKVIKFGYKPVPTVLREHVQQLFRLDGTICWGALAGDGEMREIRSAICRMILEGYLQIDFNKPIVYDSMIFAVAEKREA